MMNKPTKPICRFCNRTMAMNDEWVYECSICGNSIPPRPSQSGLTNVSAPQRHDLYQQGVRARP